MSIRTSVPAASVTLVALTLLAGSAFAQPIVTNIALPGSSSSQGIAVSGNGATVVGIDNPSSGNARAFRWTQSGGTQQLMSLGGASFANALSADGSIIVGGSTPTAPGSFGRAVRWTSPSTVQSLGTLGTGTASSANGVSADGSLVVGSSSTSGLSNFRAFRWTQSGGMESLGTLPSDTASYAYGVSAAGTVITGSSTAGSNPRAFRWTQTNGMQSLGVLAGYSESTGQGVSADGSTIVGYSGNIFGSTGSRGFRWTQGGGMQDLGVLPGGAFSGAYGTNVNGSMIVGTSTTSSDTRATLWTPSLGLVDLNAYLTSLGANLNGWTLQYANSISLDGSVIAGEGLFNGQTRGFVVTNIPTPGPAPCGLSDIAGPGQAAGADGQLTADDIIVYLNRFFAADLRADIAGPGQATTPDTQFTADDIIVFLNRFFAGC